MGALLYAWADRRHLTPLAPVTLVGRAPACLARVDHPACPAHWLEIRWSGTQWQWRPLAAPERSRGTGRALADGWQSLERSANQGTRVALGADAWVELLDDGPPEPFAWDVLADRPVEGPALEEVAELRGDQLLPLAAEGDPRAALADGQHWVHPTPDGPRTLRAHVPTPFPPTLAVRIDLRQGHTEVLVDLRTLKATFRQGATSVTVQGSCVRTLVVYQRARDEADGWLSAIEAWNAWVELGGNRELQVEAVAWDRARLRRMLDRARVGNLDLLFEQRKEGPFVKVRLLPRIDVDWIP
jgi:hypothetical protein